MTNQNLRFLLETYNKIRFQFPSLKLDSIKVVQDVVTHRDYWKPEKVKTLLLAESHVYTTDEENDNVLRYPTNGDISDFPRKFVRLVYCLGYGEWRIAPKISKNKGTPQYWKIFRACTADDLNFQFDGVLVTACVDFSMRLKNKLNVLKKLKAKGIWLVDCSIVSLYGSPIKRTEKEKRDILRFCWDNYTSRIIACEKLDYIIVVGKRVGRALGARLRDSHVPFSIMPQPQAWLPRGEHLKVHREYQKICNR